MSPFLNSQSINLSSRANTDGFHFSNIRSFLILFWSNFQPKEKLLSPENSHRLFTQTSQFQNWTFALFSPSIFKDVFLKHKQVACMTPHTPWDFPFHFLQLLTSVTTVQPSKLRKSTSCEHLLCRPHSSYISCFHQHPVRDQVWDLLVMSL